MADIRDSQCGNQNEALQKIKAQSNHKNQIHSSLVLILWNPYQNITEFLKYICVYMYTYMNICIFINAYIISITKENEILF